MFTNTCLFAFYFRHRAGYAVGCRYNPIVLFSYLQWDSAAEPLGRCLLSEESFNLFSIWIGSSVSIFLKVGSQMWDPMQYCVSDALPHPGASCTPSSQRPLFTASLERQKCVPWWLGALSCKLRRSMCSCLELSKRDRNQSYNPYKIFWDTFSFKSPK